MSNDGKSLTVHGSSGHFLNISEVCQRDIKILMNSCKSMRLEHVRVHYEKDIKGRLKCIVPWCPWQFIGSEEVSWTYQKDVKGMSN